MKYWVPAFQYNPAMHWRMFVVLVKFRFTGKGPEASRARSVTPLGLAHLPLLWLARPLVSQPAALRSARSALFSACAMTGALDSGVF